MRRKIEKFIRLCIIGYKRALSLFISFFMSIYRITGKKKKNSPMKKRQAGRQHNQQGDQQRKARRYEALADKNGWRECRKERKGHLQPKNIFSGELNEAQNIMSHRTSLMKSSVFFIYLFAKIHHEEQASNHYPFPYHRWESKMERKIPIPLPLNVRQKLEPTSMRNHNSGITLFLCDPSYVLIVLSCNEYSMAVRSKVLIDCMNHDGVINIRVSGCLNYLSCPNKCGHQCFVLFERKDRALIIVT